MSMKIMSIILLMPVQSPDLSSVIHQWKILETFYNHHPNAPFFLKKKKDKKNSVPSLQ